MPTLPRNYELEAHAIIVTGYLRTACIALALAVLVLSILVYRLNAAVSHVQVPIVVVDSTGRATISNYMGATYTPHELEIRAFASQWAIDYYSRVRFTLADSYADSLRFFDDKLARAAIDQEGSTHWIEEFISGTKPQVKVDVRNVTLSDLSHSPYTARIDFVKIFYADSFAEQKRENWIAEIAFTVHPRATADRTNPLGISIHDLRQSQAFE